jgi:hypothetical protein
MPARKKKQRNSATSWVIPLSFREWRGIILDALNQIEITGWAIVFRPNPVVKG